MAHGVYTIRAPHGLRQWHTNNKWRRTCCDVTDDVMPPPYGWLIGPRPAEGVANERCASMRPCICCCCCCWWSVPRDVHVTDVTAPTNATRTAFSMPDMSAIVWGVHPILCNIIYNNYNNNLEGKLTRRLAAYAVIQGRFRRNYTV